MFLKIFALKFQWTTLRFVNFANDFLNLKLTDTSHEQTLARQAYARFRKAVIAMICGTIVSVKRNNNNK